MKKHNLLTTAVLLSVFAGLASPAAAQTAASQSQPTASPADASAAADIVVTAQKREQKLQRVPISMEVLTAKKLDALNVADVRGMVKYTPNVAVVNSPGNDVIYIRGFGSNPGNYGFDQSVSLYVDGIYAGRSKQSQGPFFDLQRVEVLRGPQGALFGKNTAAGALSVVSAGPTRDFAGAIKGVYNFDLEGPVVEGYASGPLGDQFGARLAVKFRDQRGYMRNRFNNRDEPAIRSALARLTLRYEPSTSIDYTVKAEYAKSRQKGANNFSQARGSRPQPVTTRYVDIDGFGVEEGTRTTSWLFSGTGNILIGDHTLTSVTGYSKYHATLVNDADQTIPSGGITNNSIFQTFPDRFHQFSQELRLASPTGGRLEYLLGAYFDRSSYDVANLLGVDVNLGPAFTFDGASRSDFSQHAKTYSIFGQATVRITDAFRLMPSLRYSNTKKRAEFVARMLYGPFPLQPLTTAAGLIKEGSVDPSITLQYDVAPQIMLYASYARGSKSGGFVANTFGTTSANFAFRPEKSESYEAGVKSTLADGRLVLNLAVYDTKFKDLQVSRFNALTSTFETTNAAQAESKGVELMAALYPAKGLDFTASAAYLDAKYGDYPGAGCLATQTVAQCDPRSNASRAANNIKGTRLPYSSKFSYTLQGHYGADLGGGTLDTTVVVSGRSNYFTSADLSPLYGYQKAYAKLDGRIEYSPAGKRWHVAVIGKNLTNEKTISSNYAIGIPITAVPRAILFLEETRNIAVEAGIKF